MDKFIINRIANRITELSKKYGVGYVAHYLAHKLNLAVGEVFQLDGTSVYTEYHLDSITIHSVLDALEKEQPPVKKICYFCGKDIDSELHVGDQNGYFLCDNCNGGPTWEKRNF